uniref:Putative secreted protein n=1 Tax=Panstrongylus lignarius TaxID=156445 RepID=A0A224XXF0_9HEMI
MNSRKIVIIIAIPPMFKSAMTIGFFNIAYRNCSIISILVHYTTIVSYFSQTTIVTECTGLRWIDRLDDKNVKT